MFSKKYILYIFILFALLLNINQLIPQDSGKISEPVLSSADQMALEDLPELGSQQVLYKGNLTQLFQICNLKATNLGFSI